jgi:NitT/TauT family transport system substrate-binding protein
MFDLRASWLRALLSAGVLGLAAMGTAAAQQSPAPKLVPLKVGVLKMAALTNPWVAKQRGIFERNGLDVTLVEFRSGNEAISAHRGGSVDIVLAIPGTAMTAAERGFDLVAVAQNEVAQKQSPDTGSIQVLKDSPYRTLADLAGKRIAVSGLHSQKTVSMQTVFRNAGVDPAALQLIEIPFPSQFDALKSKQVDAVNTVDPYTTQLLASGLGRVIAWDYVDAIPEQPLGAWFAKSTFAKGNSDLIDRFNKSIKESIEYMQADSERARGEVVAYTGLDPVLVKNMPMIAWDYRVRLDKWQEVVDMMHRSGELQTPHRAEEFLSDQIKRYVVK